MKKILLISFLGFISLGIVACDNQKDKTATDETATLINEFKSSFFKSCTDSGASLSFCECTYSEVTKKYSEKDMVGIYAGTNQDAKDNLISFAKESAEKCLN